MDIFSEGMMDPTRLGIFLLEVTRLHLCQWKLLYWINDATQRQLIHSLTLKEWQIQHTGGFSCLK